MRTVLILTISLILATTASAVELRTIAQDSAPKFIRDANGAFSTGVCIDIMEAITALDPSLRFKGVEQHAPFKRILKMLEDDDVDVFFGAVRNAEREARFHFFETPLYTINHVVVVRKNDKVSVNNFEDIRRLGKQGRIVTLFGASTSKYLEKQGGLEIVDLGKSVDHILRLLLFDRGRFAYYHDLGLGYTIKSKKYADKVDILPASFKHYQHYAGYSKKLPEKIVLKLDAALRQLEANGTLQRIFDKYVSVGK